MNFFFSEKPQTHFMLKLKSYFSFLEKFSKQSGVLLGAIVINYTTNITTLPDEILDYIQVPVIIVKPSHHR